MTVLREYTSLDANIGNIWEYIAGVETGGRLAQTSGSDKILTDVFDAGAVSDAGEWINFKLTTPLTIVSSVAIQIMVVIPGGDAGNKLEMWGTGTMTDATQDMAQWYTAAWHYANNRPAYYLESNLAKQPVDNGLPRKLVSAKHI